MIRIFAVLPVDRPRQRIPRMAEIEPGSRPNLAPGRDSGMARSAHDSPRMGYLAALAMLVLAVLFPIGLMVFNPTLMFERGWEQYVGTAIYFWAVLTLGGRSDPLA